MNELRVGWDSNFNEFNQTNDFKMYTCLYLAWHSHYYDNGRSNGIRKTNCPQLKCPLLNRVTPQNLPCVGNGMHYQDICNPALTSTGEILHRQVDMGKLII